MTEHTPVVVKTLRLMLKRMIYERVLINRQKVLIALMKKQLDILETRKLIQDTANSK